MDKDIVTTKSPLKEMPECWQDDTRMNALFAPFRKRDVNPLHWDSKMTFWKRNIDTWAVDNNSSSFTIKQLQKEFQRNGRTPQCFATVVEDLLRNGEIMLKSDFLKTAPSRNQSWATWTVGIVVKTPVTWAFEKLKNTLIAPSTIDLDAVYVHYGVLKKNGDKLMEAVKGEAEDLLSVVRIKELLQTSSDEDVELTIHWLELNNLVHIASQDNMILVKFITDKNKTKEITEADLAVYTLQQNERSLMKNVEQLEIEKQNTDQEARNYLRKGMRQMAKSCLRKKKALEKCIDKRSSTLENVQTLLTRIQEAESDSKVLDSYKMGLSAMKSMFKEAGLSEEGVTNTVSQVQDVFDVHDEIQASLAEPVGDNTEDADLESELAALLANVPSQELDIDLPEVPESIQTSPVARADLNRKQREKIAM